MPHYIVPPALRFLGQCTVKTKLLNVSFIVQKALPRRSRLGDVGVAGRSRIYIVKRQSKLHRRWCALDRGHGTGFVAVACYARVTGIATAAAKSVSSVVCAERCGAQDASVGKAVG